MLDNLISTKTFLHKNDILKDPKQAVRKNTAIGNVQFVKGLLREGTILKSNGYIMTAKGRMIDSSLLDEEDPLRKKLEARQKK